MTVRELLSLLRERDIRVSVRGGRLAVNAPVGAVTQEVRAQLDAMKPQILAFLAAGEKVGYHRAVVPIRAGGTRPPVFAVPGHNGDVFCFLPIVRHLPPDQPLLALEPPGLDDGESPLSSIPELAAYFVDAIRQQQPSGPYFVAGYCMGGVTAFEIAAQLRARGDEVALCALFRTSCPTMFWKRYLVSSIAASVFVSIRGRVAGRSVAQIARKLLSKLITRRPSVPAPPPSESSLRSLRVQAATQAAMKRHRPSRFDGRVTLYLANRTLQGRLGRKLDWRRFAGGGAEIVFGPPECRGGEMLQEPDVAFFGPRFRQALECVAGESARAR